MPWKSQTGLAGVRIVFGQESAAVGLGEQAGEAPLGLLEHADVEDVHDQQVTRLRAVNADGAGQIVDLGEIDHVDVVGGVVVLDLAAGPVDALDAEFIAGIHHGDHGMSGCQRLCR